MACALTSTYMVAPSKTCHHSQRVCARKRPISDQLAVPLNQKMGHKRMDFTDAEMFCQRAWMPSSSSVCYNRQTQRRRKQVNSHLRHAHSLGNKRSKSPKKVDTYCMCAHSRRCPTWKPFPSPYFHWSVQHVPLALPSERSSAERVSRRTVH